MPKQLLQLDPELAAKHGVEAALLLGFLHQQAQLSGGRVRTDLSCLHQFFSFWDEARLLQNLESLQAQLQLRFRLLNRELEIELGEGDARGGAREAISEPRRPAAGPSPSTTVQRSRLSPNRAPQTKSEPPPVQQLPVVDNPQQIPAAAGPAPSFGRRSAWRQPSELDDIFEAAEQRRKQLREMDLNWRPSQTFFELLGRTRIDAKFAEQCIDEFIAYYVERGKAESNWDQRFLAWVKRAWPSEESKRGGGYEQQTGNRYETSRQDTRAARKRVTQAVMDVKNTDW